MSTKRDITPQVRRRYNLKINSAEEKTIYTINLIESLNNSKYAINHSIFRERIISIEFKKLQKDNNKLYEWAAVIDHITLIFMERLLAKDLPEQLCFSFKKFYEKTSELMDHFNYCHQGYFIILKLDKL